MSAARAAPALPARQFGKRGRRQSPPTPARVTASKEPHHIEDLAPRIETATPEIEIPHRASSTAWAYLKACAAAFTATMAAIVFVDGTSSPLADLQLFQTIVSGFVAMSLAPMMALPAFVLAQIAMLARLPRGIADIVVGGILGSAWIALALSKGQAPDLMHYCFVLGGLVGGFAFWRSKGYPGASRSSARSIELAYQSQP